MEKIHLINKWQQMLESIIEQKERLIIMDQDDEALSLSLKSQHELIQQFITDINLWQTL